MKYKALFLPNAKINQYNDLQRDLGVDRNLHEGHIKNQLKEDFNMWLIVWKITRIEVKRKFNQNTFQTEFTQMKKKGNKGTNKGTKKALGKNNPEMGKPFPITMPKTEIIH